MIEKLTHWPFLIMWSASQPLPMELGMVTTQGTTLNTQPWNTALPCHKTSNSFTLSQAPSPETQFYLVTSTQSWNTVLPCHKHPVLKYSFTFLLNTQSWNTVLPCYWTPSPEIQFYLVTSTQSWNTVLPCHWTPSPETVLPCHWTPSPETQFYLVTSTQSWNTVLPCHKTPSSETHSYLVTKHPALKHILTLSQNTQPWYHWPELPQV